MTHPIRVIAPEQFDAFSGCLNAAFGWEPFTAAERELFLPLVEWDRTLATFDGEDLVGTCGTFSLDVGVPGGSVPMAGVTMVSVLPTHRRRGILRAAMVRQLRDIADAGTEAIAGLWASEPAIYQRFGYGCASWQAGCTVQRGTSYNGAGRATLASHEAPVRLVQAQEGIAIGRTVLAELVPRSPGALMRSEGTWQLLAADPPRHRAGASGLFWIVTEGGYANYRLRPSADSHSIPAGTVELGELVATTPGAYAALWRYVLDLDLCTTISSRIRPLQDPLLLLLEDPRRARFAAKDGLWLRLVDLPRALTERRYAAPCSISVRVHDELLTDNDGTWLVEVDELGAATVSRTSGPGDLECDIGALGAAHLGSTGLAWLAAAGRVTEHTSGALRCAARSWGWDVPASCTEIF